MNWIPLEAESQLRVIIDKSTKRPQVIFKHSTRCPISKMIMNRLEKSEQPENVDFYYLDLLKFRILSNKIADDFQIRHESPQVILLSGGKPVYNEDHSAITMEDLTASV